MVRFSNKLLLLVLVILTINSIPGLAQGTAKEEILTNETILTLTKESLPPNLIVNKIKSTKANFNTTTEELLRLKQAGVADEVINAMISAGSPGATTKVNDSGPVDVNDAASPHPWLSI
ncbi:MAG TPA: hypothetical protein VFC63_15315 [Blastocatellia bacterium]|nr:hypothetical protein [Blastocatellia bacterium]